MMSHSLGKMMRGFPGIDYPQNFKWSRLGVNPNINIPLLPGSHVPRGVNLK